MSFNLQRIVHAGVAVAFSLGAPIVRAGTYVRPASFNPYTGLTVTVEVASQCNAIVASVSTARFLGFTTVAPGTEILLIRASELLSVPAPAAGDFFIETSSGLRRNVKAARLDLTGEFYSFQCERALDEDWGDLTAAVSFDDWGDLTLATVFDDYGTLQ